jgi:AbrB family looped-hinge helix DNA binding protein
MGVLVGKGISMGITRIDRRGRVTLPADLRRELALLPGDSVIVERAAEGIAIRRVRSREAISRRLRGIITAKNAVEKLDPMDLKRLVQASD